MNLLHWPFHAPVRSRTQTPAAHPSHENHALLEDWHESTLELMRGLEVTEHADSSLVDLTDAAPA